MRLPLTQPLCFRQPHPGQVEMAPLCSAEARPGRPSEAAVVLTEQLTCLLESAAVVDRRQLCIDPGKAAWAVYLDLFVLDAGGWVLRVQAAGRGDGRQAGRQVLNGDLGPPPGRCAPVRVRVALLVQYARACSLTVQDLPALLPL